MPGVSAKTNAPQITIDDARNVTVNLRWQVPGDKRVESLSDKRKIWVQSFTDATLLKNFIWSELDSTEQRLFQNRCTAASKLSQCNNLTSTQRRELTGERLVNYLRGQFAFEDRAENSLKLFRRRDHVLGAVMSAQPLYVGRPAFRYADENYGAFRDDLQVNRKGMLYVAANDGMLHALDAATGAEDWAFIPAAVLPTLYKLADTQFGQQSTYLLDGSPVAGDICPGTAPVSCTASAWRTILVGGLS